MYAESVNKAGLQAPTEGTTMKVTTTLTAPGERAVKVDGIYIGMITREPEGWVWAGGQQVSGRTFTEAARALAERKAAREDRTLDVASIARAVTEALTPDHPAVVAAMARKRARRAPALAVADLERMTEDDRWHGFGYLGGRAAALDGSDPECPARPELVAEVDAEVIRLANEAGLDYEGLFEWANSKTGRWYGDVVFGGGALERAAAWKLTPGHPDH